MNTFSVFVSNSRAQSEFMSAQKKKEKRKKKTKKEVCPPEIPVL